MFCATVLALEAFVVFFAALAVFGLRAAGTAQIVVVSAVAVVVCLVAAGLLRHWIGYLLGSAVQVALILAGALLSEVRLHLLPLGITFAVIWLASLAIGARLDVERAERYQVELAHHREREGAREAS